MEKIENQLDYYLLKGGFMSKKKSSKAKKLKTKHGLALISLQTTKYQEVSSCQAKSPNGKIRWV